MTLQRACSSGHIQIRILTVRIMVNKCGHKNDLGLRNIHGYWSSKAKSSDLAWLHYSQPHVSIVSILWQHYASKAQTLPHLKLSLTAQPLGEYAAKTRMDKQTTWSAYSSTLSSYQPWAPQTNIRPILHGGWPWRELTTINHSTTCGWYLQLKLNHVYKNVIPRSNVKFNPTDCSTQATISINPAWESICIQEEHPTQMHLDDHPSMSFLVTRNMHQLFLPMTSQVSFTMNSTWLKPAPNWSVKWSTTQELMRRQTQLRSLWSRSSTDGLCPHSGLCTGWTICETSTSSLIRH